MDNFLAFLIIGIGLVIAASYGYGKYLEFAGGDWDQRMALIFDAVTAAEQMHGSLPGAKRLEWVTSYIQRRFPDIEAEDLRVMVEAAVYRLKQHQPAAEDDGLDFWAGSGRSN